MSTDTVEVTKTYSDIVNELRDAGREIDQKRVEAENKAYTTFQEVTQGARKKRQEAFGEADKVYTAAMEKRTEMREAAETAYQEETQEASKANAAANKEAKAVAAKERSELAEKLAEGSDLKNVKLLAWFVSHSVWSSYQGSCELVLDFLDKKPRTLDEVVKFGRRDQGWCSTFSTYLLQAIDAGVLPFETSEEGVAKVRLDMQRESVGMYNEQRDRFMDVLSEMGVKSGDIEKLSAAISGE